MAKFKVLLATDGSRSARRALDLLQDLPLPEIDLHLLNVVETDRGWLKAVSSLDDAGAELRATAQQILDSEAKRVHSPGWSVSTVVREGNAASCILEEANALNCDLVAAGASGGHGFGAALVGRTSERVVVYAPCSVLVVREPDSESGVGWPVAAEPWRAVVAFDGSEPAQAAVSMLSSWPVGARVEFDLITVMELVTLYRMDLVQRLGESWQLEKQRSHEALESARATLSSTGARTESHLVESDDTLGAVKELLTRRRAQLLVLGYKGRHAVKRFLVGSISLKLMQGTACSVLVVRPPNLDAGVAD